MAWTNLIHIVSAGRGAAGTTAIEGARSVQFDIDSRTKVAKHGGRQMPTRVFRTAHMGRVAVVTDDLGEIVNHMTLTGKEKLRITYMTSAGQKSLQALAVEAGGVENLEFQETERNGETQPMRLVFNVIEDSDNQTIAAALAQT